MRRLSVCGVVSSVQRVIVVVRSIPFMKHIVVWYFRIRPDLTGIAYSGLNTEGW